jgi:ATP-dependent helicase/nuclease subunit B
MTPRVFNIPASAPFLPTLIEALHDGKLGFDFADDMLALSSTTLYLPTRRACRLMREAFLDRLRGDGAILRPAASPRMHWHCRGRWAGSNASSC